MQIQLEVYAAGCTTGESEADSIYDMAGEDRAPVESIADIDSIVDH